MDPLEEQKQEIEILQSIYPDEFEQVSQHEFTINLRLDTESDRTHYIKLQIRYPKDYPEVVPEIKVLPGDGDEVDEEDETDDEEDIDEDAAAIRDSKKAINLIETVTLDEDDMAVLAKRLEEEAEMNIGMPSAFSLASVLKDEAEQSFAIKVKVETRKLERAREAREKEEQKKFNGTKVTEKSFNEWRDRFRKEMGYDQRMEQRYKEIHQGKMTGKEIFEKGLAGDEDLDDDVDGAVRCVAGASLS